MARALLTGITGQTGSYLAERLLDSGWHLHGLVRPGDSNRAWLNHTLPQAELIEADLADEKRLQDAVLEVQPDAIFNLGGLTSVSESWSQPLLTARVTGYSVAVLLEAAIEVQRSAGKPVAFVQASSAEMFGIPAETPQNEQTPIRPTNPYGAAKAYAHHLVGVYRELGLHSSSCILYNHESPRRPETFVTRKITRGVARIAAGRQDVLELGNLEVRRDWGWAPDYARAIELIANAARADDYVVATGESHSVAEFVAAAFRAVGIEDWQGLVRQDERLFRPNDALEQVGDPAKLRSELGWGPSVDFEDMVQAMVEADLSAEGVTGRARDVE